MTSTIVESLEKIQSSARSGDEDFESQNKTTLISSNEDNLKADTGAEEKVEDPHRTLKDDASLDVSIEAAERLNERSHEPTLSNPKVGNPISHSQVIDLSVQLKTRSLSPRTLDALLRGSRVFIAPPPPKPEPTSEYKELMARLRREEEARSYERMTNPIPPMETFAQRFPMSSAAHAFPSYQEPEAEDEVTYADINRQMAMIANVLLSILACAGAIWMVARWWSTPARLALSMSGSLLVGVAEVVVYGGYIRRVSEAKGKEKSVKEVKEVVRTWVVGGGEEKQEESVLIEGKQDLDNMKARRRKKEVE